LRPSKPLPVGKKVKCPKCGTGFVVGGEEEPEPAVRAPKAAVQPAPAKAKPAEKKPAPKPADDEEDEGGTYAVVGLNPRGTTEEEEEAEEEDDKPEINYVPDLSVKDLRGPAQEAVVKPSNFLIMVGLASFIGWIGFLILVLIPILFPLEEKKEDKDKKGFVTAAQKKEEEEKKKKEAETVSFFSVAGYNLRDLAKEEWTMIALAISGILAGMAYTGVMIMGAVQMQNLESRTFGIASSIMAIIPLHANGLMALTAIFLQLLFGMLMDDRDLINMYLTGFTVILGLLGVAAGVRGLICCLSEQVKAGFEYKAE
jgi:hypothetical protein